MIPTGPEMHQLPRLSFRVLALMPYLVFLRCASPVLQLHQLLTPGSHSEGLDLLSSTATTFLTPLFKREHTTLTKPQTSAVLSVQKGLY